MCNVRHNKKIREGVQLCLMALLLFAGRSAIADWNRIPSGSMQPTLYVGDLILVNKLAYDLKIPFTTIHLAEWANPQRGEVVVFYHPEDGRRMVKRVIGVPGDTIEMIDNCLIINGNLIRYQPTTKSLQYPLISEDDEAVIATEYLPEGAHSLAVLPSKLAMRLFGPVHVSEGQYFMLGDNRDNSGDSRYFGMVSRDQVLGRVERTLISWDAENNYNPRFERFMHGLDSV